MQRQATLLILIAVLGVALGGASCSEHGDDQAARQPSPPAARSGYQVIPQQQIQPRVQSLPRP